MTSESPERDPEKLVGLIAGRLVGSVLSLIGIAGIALFLWTVSVGASQRRGFDSTAFLILGGLLTVAVFCALVGFRLFLNRPNRYGSILSPIGWAVLGTVFALSALAILVLAVTKERPEFLANVPLGAVFSWGCFMNGRRVARQKSGDT